MSKLFDELCGEPVAKNKSRLATLDSNWKKAMEELFSAHGVFECDKLDGTMNFVDFKVFTAICMRSAQARFD
jgi:hypothetical protein